MTATPELPVIVGSFPKNRREDVQVSLSEYKGVQLLDARIFVDDGETTKATTKGLSIRVGLLPDLIALLTEAEAKARALGMIGGGA